jgi:hypothetical protein
MAKNLTKHNEERAKKDWSEGEMIQSFHLERIVTYETPLMLE